MWVPKRVRSKALRAVRPWAQAVQYRCVRRRVMLDPWGDVAAVVHLYYPDTWPAIASALRESCPNVPVVVTVARHEVNLDELAQHLPGALFIRVPNRGRDVLPFLELARALRAGGVRYVVKVHGKQSLHTPDGAAWFEGSLSALLPGPEVVRRCVDALRAGVPLIGPAGMFYRATTYWSLNRDGVEAVTGPLDAWDAGGSGFFGGTMWWARLDALDGVPAWGPRDFPDERGQFDGTTAHAFERIVCLLPQMAGNELWEVDEDGPRPISGFGTPPA